jgi:hypothetical protein
MVVVLWGGPLAAEEAQAPGSLAQAGATSEAACTAACQGVITRCTSVFGPAMGDMRPSCTRAVLRRCRALGIAACESPAGAR